MNKVIGIMICLMLFTVSMSNSVQAADSLRTRAMNAYNPALTKTILSMGEIGDKKTNIERKYNSQYIPVKDAFGPYVDSLVWNKATKVVTVKNNGKEMILNFSGKKVTGKTNQVVLPGNWTKLVNGQATINGSILTYLFDEYGSSYNDMERDQWQEQLSFLNIDHTDGIPGVRDGYMHVYLAYNKN